MWTGVNYITCTFLQAQSTFRSVVNTPLSCFQSFPFLSSLSFSLPPFLSLPFSPLSVCLCFCFLNKARNLVSKYNQGAIKNKERPKFLKTWGKEPCLFFFIPLQYFFTMLVNDRAVLYWLAFIFRTNSYAQKYWQ